MTTRRHFSPEQKATIVRRHLAGKEPVSKELGIQPSQIQLWVKQLLDQAERAFQSNGRKRTSKACCYATASPPPSPQLYHYYIRRFSSTVELRANSEEEQELLRLTATVPFDADKAPGGMRASQRNSTDPTLNPIE